MKSIVERILIALSILALIAVIITMVFQWKKDTELWRSIRGKVFRRKLVDLD